MPDKHQEESIGFLLKESHLLISHENKCEIMNGTEIKLIFLIIQQKYQTKKLVNLQFLRKIFIFTSIGGGLIGQKSTF